MAKQYNRVMLGRGGQYAEECRKVIYNGKVYVLQEGKSYTLTGQEIK